MPAPGTDDLGRLIAQARRRVWRSCVRALEDQGASMLVWQVLVRLAGGGPSTQNGLALDTAQHPAGLSRLLDKLERDGLVTRTRDPSDRRRVQVAVTPAGRTLANAWRPWVRKAAAEALAILDPAEQQDLARILRKLVG